MCFFRNFIYHHKRFWDFSWAKAIVASLLSYATTTFRIFLTTRSTTVLSHLTMGVAFIYLGFQSNMASLPKQSDIQGLERQAPGPILSIMSWEYFLPILAH